MAKARNASRLRAPSGLGWLALAMAVALIPLFASPALADEPATAPAKGESATSPAKDESKTDGPASSAKVADADSTQAKGESATKASAPTKDASSAEAEDLPGTYQLPLRAKASRETMPTPATFTISGKKFLQGRTLKAGEFTFHIALAGVAQVPMKNDLPSKLGPNSSLSDAEKYELAAHSGLVYHPSSTQPVPSSTYVTNTADGDVVFPSLTFDGAAVGETATIRHLGAIFCYTIAEMPPRNSSGELLDGVTRDNLGRYIYQGVTYDDAVKRVYLYVYQTTGADGAPALAVVPLGDATFGKMPGRTASGAGVGFLNVFHGTQIDAYDGVVYLEGQPIAAGEFRFEVRKVSESGKVLDEQSVACDGTEDGAVGAEVPVIRDHVYEQAGRFFYAVSQTAAEKSAPAGVRLDETSYIVTVEVAPNDEGDLQASITYVRKKAPGATQWTDVNVDAEPSPVVWQNSLVTAGASGTEKPGDTPSGGTGEEGPGADDPAADDGTAIDRPTGTKPSEPAPGTEGDTGSVDAGTGAGAGEVDGTKPGDVAKPDAGGSEATGTENGVAGDSTGANIESAGTQEGAAAGSDAATHSRDGKGKADAQTSGVFAQTGDDLGPLMLIVFIIVIASGVILAVASGHRKPRS